MEDLEPARGRGPDGAVRKLRPLALAAATLTLVLITVGGLVTNTDSGLACPDWPMCFGTPFPRMVGGILYEHGHRYLAAAVGLLMALVAIGTLWRGRQGALAIALCASSALLLGAAFKAGTVQYARGEVPAGWAALVLFGALGCGVTLWKARGAGRLAAAALLLLMVQGLLGGLTVVYRLPVTVLVLHLATSMLFLAVALALALRLGPEGELGAPAGRPLLWTTSGALYLQIVLGATVRHTGAGLVCTDLPFCRGALWPSQVHPAVHLHMAHRALAFLVAGLVLAVSIRLFHAPGSGRVVRALSVALPLLVVVQIGLGVLTIATLKSLVPVTGHLFVAALLFASCVALLGLREEPRAARLPATDDAPALSGPSLARSPHPKSA